MNTETITRIETLIDKISELEISYKNAVAEHKDYTTLRNLRIEIRTMKDALQVLELSLLNGLDTKVL